MSYTELLTVRKNGDVVSEKEFKNSYLSAMIVWLEMGKRYGIIRNDESYYGTDFKKIWSLWKRTDIPESHRIVMAFTFDRVVIRKSEFEIFIDAVKQYCQDFAETGHISEQAAHIATLQFNDDVIGVCWNQTSISCDFWSVPTEEEEDEYRPYNIFTDSEHWFLFDELVKKKKDLFITIRLRGRR